MSSFFIFPLPFKFGIIFKGSDLNKIIVDLGNGIHNFREINQISIDFKVYFIHFFWYLAMENMNPA